jgi:tetratricopeptide (TPR) repeat protein
MPKDAQASAKDTTFHIQALDDVNARIKKDSLNPELYFRRAQLHQGQKDIKSALSDMYIAVMLDSANSDYNLYAADLFMQINEPRRAIAWMDRSIAVDSSNIKYYLYGGRFAYMIKDYPTALSHFNQAITKDMFNADIYYYKGMVYKEMGDTSKALSSFQTCAEQDPKKADAFLQIGLILQQRGDKMADKYLSNAIKANPKATDALYAKGYGEQEAGKYGQSIATFKQIIDVDYKNENALYAIGESYLQLDSLKDAYKYFGIAIKMDPRYAEAYYKRGRCAEEFKNYNEARSLYQQCLNIKPGFTLAKEGLKRIGGG